MVIQPKIAIVLVATNDFTGRLVRWADNSKINHAMLVYEDELWTGFWKAEALFKEGVVRPPFDPDDPRYERMEFFVYRGDPSVGLPKLRWTIGADYDYKGAVLGTIRLIIRKITGKMSDASIHDHKKLFCFEFVINYLHNLRAAGAERLIPENTSPAMLREWLIEHEDFQQMSIEQFMEDV